MRSKAKLASFALLVLFASQVFPAALAAASPPSQAATVVLTVIPPKLPADGQSYPALVVSLLDSNGLPTAAFQDLTVFLTSSEPNIASVPDSVVIAAGQEYAIANASTTSTPGTTMITAHIQGLNTQALSYPLTTVTPSGYPSKLVVFTSPSTFLPRADSGVVRVEVVDDAGLPSKAITAIPVLLTSSNGSIASLTQTSLTIAEGNIIADGTFHTTSPGSAVIAAASNGYSTGTALVTVSRPCTTGCGAYKLGLRVVPGVLPSDGNGYSVLEISLQTSSGAPATLSSDTVVQLSSDQSAVASVPGLVSIPAGSISTLAQVTTSALAGVANVTATSAGLIPATIPVKTVIPAPSQLHAYVAPVSSAYSPGGNYPILVVQLQDSSGNPARARQDTSLVVTSSNGSLLSSFITLGISKGADYVFSYLHTMGVGTSQLTVSSQGLASSQVKLQSTVGPLVATLALTSSSSSYIYDNQTATFTFHASFVGTPLKDLNVSWAATGGTLNPTNGNTGAGGTSSTTFTPGSYGRYNITANAFSPQTGPISLFYSLLVVQTPPRPTPSLLERIIGYWYYIVAAVAVVIVAVVYLLRMRRKKARAEIEAGFEVV